MILGGLRGLTHTQRLCGRHLSTMATFLPASFGRLVRFVDNTGVERVGELLIEQGEGGTGQAKDYENGTVHTIAKYLPPVRAVNVLCVGLNYSDHAKEVSMEKRLCPVVFSKATSCLLGHGESIQLPTVAEGDVDYEAELAVVIGEPCKNATQSTALDYVAGYTAANDVTSRRWQGKKGGGQWVRAKSFDTFGPLGPVLASPEVVGDPQGLGIKTVVNGQTLQDGHTSNMLFSVADLIVFLSQDTTLLPGTVILTGTPAGVGYIRRPPVILKAGDTVSVTIDKIGTLCNSVVGPQA